MVPGNFAVKVVKMLMRIEDRCDKVSNKITHIEERLMRLVYREHEVIRICLQAIGEANPEVNKEWIKGAIETELECFEGAQERQKKRGHPGEEGFYCEGCHQGCYGELQGRGGRSVEGERGGDV